MQGIVKQLIGASSMFLVSLLITLSSNIVGQVNGQRTRIETNLVLVDVLVIDKAGRPARGIGSDKFELFIDNLKQPIDSFSSEEAPVTFGIIYDMHPTTADRNRTVIESLREFRNKLPSDDDVFLAAFNMSGLQAFDFIPTVEQLERHMTDPATRRVRSLYDAVDFASDRIQTSRHQKRMLLIISDSADHQSRHSFSQLRDKLVTFRSEVYAIVVDDPSNEIGYADITHNGQPRYPYSSDASSLDRASVSELTLKTGGATFFCDSRSSDRLLNIYQQIATEMRSHYTLGFYPATIDALSHRIRVKLHDVPNIKDLVLTYRMSYTTPQPREF